MSLNKHVADNLRISVEVCLGFSQWYIVDLCFGYGWFVGFRRPVIQYC